MSRIIYTLNGYNLNTLGIIVKSADGLIDLPELKKRQEFNWADMHGKIIDTRRPYFEPRTITLDCAWPIEAGGAYNMQTAQQKIREDLLNMGEPVQLVVDLGLTMVVHGQNVSRPLVFNVLQDKAVQFGRKYSGNTVLLTFKITLIEPQPCKAVLRHTAGNSTHTATLAFTVADNSTLFDVDWGDGAVTYDAKAAQSTSPFSISLQHTYTANGTYYIVLQGDIANVGTISQTGSVPNPLLLWTLK